LGIAAVALGGCFERHAPDNPFIGPFGSSEEGSFAALPAGDAGQDQASAARHAPAAAPPTADLAVAGTTPAAP
jgi:hypothetical protein